MDHNKADPEVLPRSPHHAHPPGPLGPPYRVGAEDLQIGFLRLKQLGHHLEETLHEEVDALAVTGHEQLVQRLHGDAHVSGESSTTAIAQPHAEYSVLITKYSASSLNHPHLMSGTTSMAVRDHLGSTQLKELFPGCHVWTAVPSSAPSSPALRSRMKQSCKGA